MVRKAKYSDAHAIKGLVRKAWALTPYGHLPISDVKLSRTVHEYLTHQRSRIWVSEIDGEVKGMLAGSVGQLEVSECLGATDSIFYCRTGEGPELIQRYVKWAKNQGAEVVGMCVSSGNKYADKLISSSGFKRAGGNFYWSDDE
ncbi:GNAT family N-acetyltransferase [uncultured Paraglaciecola sp.]|uniref:GNAT family N-acetyltransferase n=1 Tax=uncultured Paraglaciecola sp. TaxID=1765024 RepID=UPI00260D9495|nr:GNAT family N-acetyltransferase [uncultured Paraglaciecola sp.]